MKALLVFTLIVIGGRAEGGCAALAGSLKGFSCVRRLALPLASDNFEVEGGGRRLILRATRAESSDSDLDLKVRTKLLAKNANCTLGLLESDYVNGFSVQILEFADQSLRSRMPGMRDEAIAAAFVGLAHCLAALHQLGFVHASLRPEQVYFNSRDQPKLLSFESAVELAARAGGRGFVPYIAPEVAEGWNERPQWSAAQDVWSFGVMLFEAVNGAPPFVAESLAELREELRNTPSLILKPPVEVSIIEAVNKSVKIAEKNRLGARELGLVLNKHDEFYPKYIERQVSISLNSFTVLEKPTLFEMFSELIMICVLCLIIIPMSVYLITVKVHSDENVRMNELPAADRARRLAPLFPHAPAAPNPPPVAN